MQWSRAVWVLSIVEPFAAKVWRAHGVVVRPFEAAIEYEYVLSYPEQRHTLGSRRFVP